MKKLISSLLILGLLFTWFSLSEAIFTWWGIEVTSQSDKETKLTANVNLAWSELEWVHVRFCNNWLEDLTDKISWTLWQMEKWEICVVVKNDSSKNVKVNIKFFTTTDAWFKMCNQNIENIFGSFIDNPQTQIKVPAWDYVVQNFKIQFPLWINWKQWWCLFYNVEREDTSDQMVNIVVWKAMFLDYFVWDVWEITNDLKLTVLKKEIVNNELIVEIWAKNKWNIDLKTEISGSLTNIFWIKKDFSLSWEVVRVDNSLVFSLNFGQLPNYKWLFNIDITAKHTPHFDIDISNFDIDPEILAEKETSITSMYFEMPRVILITLLVIIVLLILATRKRKEKIVYVEKQN